VDYLDTSDGEDAGPTNSSATFGTFRGLILRSQLIILLKQKVSICRNCKLLYACLVFLFKTSHFQRACLHTGV